MSAAPAAGTPCALCECCAGAGTQRVSCGSGCTRHGPESYRESLSPLGRGTKVGFKFGVVVKMRSCYRVDCGQSLEKMPAKAISFPIKNPTTLFFGRLTGSLQGQGFLDNLIQLAPDGAGFLSETSFAFLAGLDYHGQFVAGSVL